MPQSSSVGSPQHATTAASDEDYNQPLAFVHTISGAGRLLPSSSHWNSIEIDFNILPQSNAPSGYESLPSRFSKSYDYNLIVTDKAHLRRCVYVTASIFLAIALCFFLLHFVPLHKHHHRGSVKNLTLAVNQALVFFDAQKSGILPKNNLVKFRGDSGLQDGNSSTAKVDLVGGFYDSGNNIKFSLSTAYTTTLLSWTVIEYHEKYDDIAELDHIKDIIKWGSDYLLKAFVPRNSSTSSPTKIFSQVGSGGNDSKVENDVNCWQRPEDMRYERPVSVCDSTASDLAGEIIAALSAASLVFKKDEAYSGKLIKAAEELFDVASKNSTSHIQGMYTNSECGKQASEFYNSSGFKDELIWGGAWLFFSTGNKIYLDYATQNFDAAVQEELSSEKGIFYWNNKLTATMILLTRLRFFLDLGYPYEDAFGSSTNRTDLLMCSYLNKLQFSMTEGGLILLKPKYGAPLPYAATASFLSKLYSDYLDLLRRSGSSCAGSVFTLDKLRRFSRSQVDYILGDNPMKMSYIVGFGDKYPTHVYHRGASIPWDHRRHECAEGDKWLNSKEPNPNQILGAMVGGPDHNDIFLDDRDKPWFTEATISSNAGLLAALIAHHDSPLKSQDNLNASSSNGLNLGIDMMGIFQNIHILP
ncbi:Endoglucanase [Heracleum sosnowskyi]|uniref:cellulase n=1 Tax=Heracleum sosnowskyi TaxID=360622 RepID=A0AAD8H7X1_9APIA|nr:Endoglucanase [Heracleum sosnowskyi]